MSLLLLLPLPVLALNKLGRNLDPAYLVGYGALISTFTALAYWRDKRRAEAGEWRIPEKVLHGLELAGGWPAAFGMQQILRHKCSKLGYQVQFWGIVALHQYVALDYLKDWGLTETAFRRLWP